MWALLLLAGCEPAGRADSAELPVERPETLTPAAQLTRASLDLLGRRPDPPALTDPAAFEALLDTAASDPALGRRAAWLWNLSLHTAAWEDDLARIRALSREQQRAIAWEPLAGIEAIVNEDRPFTELFTAQEWPSNETVASLWGLPYSGEAGAWVWTQYGDHRALAGILSTNGLWIRHAADQTNVHRRRANMLARVFLCADFFDRDVLLEADAVGGGEAVEEAVREVPACANCHSALDPLAAFLGGFAERSEPTGLDAASQYSPFLADYTAAIATPAYFGHPGADLADLGAMMAADPRFIRCTVRRTYEGLTGASFDAAPEREALVRSFAAGGYRYDALMIEVIRTEAWGDPALRRLPAEGFVFAISEALGLPAGPSGAWEGLDDLLLQGSLRVLAGDSDDMDVALPASATAPAHLLYADWVANVAVPEALALDEARAAADRVLLPPVESPDEAAIRAQLASLYGRFTGVAVAADAAEVERLHGLWVEAGESWEEVLIALVRHPRGRLY